MSELLTHAALCALAVKWLKRPHSAGGPGCTIAVSEVKSGWTGEIPDAFGVRATGGRDGSVVVEVKVSRADFLADKAKPHRQAGKGVGNWRYFMCPEGVIKPEEVPEGWGLLWVNGRQHVKAMLGPVAEKYYGPYTAALELYRHEADFERERWLLTKLLARVGDVESMNQSIRQAYAEQSRLTRVVNDQRERILELERELRRLRQPTTRAALLTPTKGITNAEPL